MQEGDEGDDLGRGLVPVLPIQPSHHPRLVVVKVLTLLLKWPHGPREGQDHGVGE